MVEYNDLIFEISRQQVVLVQVFRKVMWISLILQNKLPKHLIRDVAAELPEVSELTLVRHYTALSNKNHGIDNGFYPLGSCTMKYNPKINEDVARFEGFSRIHPINQLKRYRVH